METKFGVQTLHGKCYVLFAHQASVLLLEQHN